jgi:hypothetical protein
MREKEPLDDKQITDGICEECQNDLMAEIIDWYKGKRDDDPD